MSKTLAGRLHCCRGNEHLQTDLRIGYVLNLLPKTMARNYFDLPLYASLGHSLGRAEAGELSTSVTLGVSVIRTPE